MMPDEIIAQAKDLPVVSETARKLAIQLNQPDLHRDDLVKTLRCDNVLTAKVLRVCNSAEYGARSSIVSLDEAILLLGDQAIFRMVCAIGFGGSLGTITPGYDTEANGLWTHSFNVGTGAEYLADGNALGDFSPSAAFTAGLLHDIGKTVINKVLTPKARADIRAIIAGKSVTRTQAEKLVLGADHSEVGACLLKRWSLPESIVEAVANHHHPAIKPAQLSAVVYLANAAVHLCGGTHGFEAHIAHVNKTSSDVLGLDIKEVERLVAAVQNAIEAAPELKAA